MRTPFRLPVLFFAALCASAPAFAADVPKAASPSAPPAATPSKPKDRVDTLFLEGLAAFDAGRLEEARAKLTEAWTLRHTHDIATNLGVVELKRGENVAATTHLAWAVANVPPTESSAMRQGIQAQFARARALVGGLRIRVSVEGAEVTVNGRRAGASPIAEELFVEPGVASVSARREGYAAAQQSITVPKGETRDVVLTLSAEEKTERRSIIPGAVLGAVGGAAVLAGIGLLVGSSSKASSASGLHDEIAKGGHDCTLGAPSYDARCETLASTSKDANLFRDAGVGLLIGGGLLGAGAATYFLWPESGAQKKPSSSLRVVPTSLRAGGGVLALGSF